MRREHYERDCSIEHPTDPDAPLSEVTWAVHKVSPRNGPVFVTVAESQVNALRQNNINGEIHRAATTAECAPKIVQQVVNIENWLYRSESSRLTPDQVTCLIYNPNEPVESGNRLALQPMTQDKDGKVIADGKPVPFPPQMLEPQMLQTLEQMSQEQGGPSSRSLSSAQDNQPQWLPLKVTDMKFRVEGVSATASVRVSEVRSASGRERDKFILEDQTEGNALSLEKSPVRDEAIREFCNDNQIKPDAGDWYVRDQDGRLQAVTIAYERVERENPTFTYWTQNDILNKEAQENAKESLPNVWVDEPRTSLRSLTPGESDPVSTAWADASQQQLDRQKGAQGYDLAQEYLPSI